METMQDEKKPLVMRTKEEVEAMREKLKLLPINSIPMIAITLQTKVTLDWILGHETDPMKLLEAISKWNN